MTEPYADFARQLRQHCEAHGLSQAQVTRNFRHSGTIVNHYFHGRHAPIEDNEPDFAGAIGVPRNTLREWLGRPPITDAKAQDLDRVMVELRALLAQMVPRRRRAVLAIVREVARL